MTVLVGKLALKEIYEMHKQQCGMGFKFGFAWKHNRDHDFFQALPYPPKSVKSRQVLDLNFVFLHPIGWYYYIKDPD